MLNHEEYDSVVIGAGFFGMYIAEYLSLHGQRVLLCEKEDRCMTRASYVNQARIHNGYHYPRSLLTALRSRISFPKFIKEFPESVNDDFEKYYAIGKILSKITATQFKEFCNRICAPCEFASPKITNLFNAHYIEAVFRCHEFSFDANILCDIMLRRLEAAGSELSTSTIVSKVTPTDAGLNIIMKCDGNNMKVAVQDVYNCTYSHINFLNHCSGLELIPLKHEMTEMVLVEPPHEIADKGITVMCGPFFSSMPFPSRKLHSISHVRYTPHYEWYDQDKNSYISSHDIYNADTKKSSYESMKRDIERYMPCMNACQYRDSIWEVKTILPASEIDDSRPILFKSNYILKGYHCILGGKIDNIYDVIEEIRQLKGY